MNKKVKILIIVVILIIVSIVGVIAINKYGGKTATRLQQAEGITIVPTMRDTITADSSWCGTFQLI